MSSQTADPNLDADSATQGGTGDRAPAQTAPLDLNDDIVQQVRRVVAAAEDLKAIRLQVLHLQPVTDFTDFFLICSGASDRQVKAIADAVVRRLRTDVGLRPLHEEGLRQAAWVLLDYGDFVVHIFDEEQRDFYALERLWGDAPDITEQLASHPS